VGGRSKNKQLLPGIGETGVNGQLIWRLTMVSRPDNIQAQSRVVSTDRPASFDAQTGADVGVDDGAAPIYGASEFKSTEDKKVPMRVADLSVAGKWRRAGLRAVGISLKPTDFDNSKMSFFPHIGEGRFGSALAMSVSYEPIVKIRGIVERSIGRSLDFYKGWNANGEAHVTTVTPVEYYDVLRPHLSMEEINGIAQKMNIQDADLEYLAVGHGGNIKTKQGETFFVVVRSKKLLAIRDAIHKAFIAKGGRAADWDPNEFYPHVTIGYTGSRDLHISDGVQKDVKHSADPRFILIK
jgi:Swiss Army Knife, 2H phosphoesterase domain